MKRYMCLCSIALIFTLLLGACGAANDSGAYSPSATPPPAAGSGSMPAPSADSSYDAPAAPSDSAGSSGGSLTPLPILTPSDSRGRRLIYSVELQLQTIEFMEGNSLLKTTIGDMGGYIVNAVVYGRDMRAPDIERSASYVFRLLTERLAEFIVEMEQNYNLLNLRQSSDDVTVSYESLDAVIYDFREREKRLLEELDDPELEDSIRRELENNLFDIQSAIRNFDIQQSSMDDSILYSTITVHLSEVIFDEEIEEEEIIAPTFGERFGLAASRSWDGFVSLCQGLLIFFIRALPTILILGVVTFTVILIVRKHKKWRVANPRQKKAPKHVYTDYQYQNPYSAPTWNRPPHQPEQDAGDPGNHTDNTTGENNTD